MTTMMRKSKTRSWGALLLALVFIFSFSGASLAQATTVDKIDLNTAHIGTAWDASGFQGNDNGGLTDPVVWHFVLTTDATAATLTVIFDNSAFNVTSMPPDRTNGGTQHWYVGTETGVILSNAFATLATPIEFSNNLPNLNLSSIAINKACTDTGCLTVKKVWGEKHDQTPPASVDVTITGPGVAENARTQTLNDGNEWSYTWTGLTIGATYTVSETVPDGWNQPDYDSSATQTLTTDNSKPTVTITNSYPSTTPPVGDTGCLTVHKDWVANGHAIPETVAVTITGPNGYTDKQTLTADKDDWSYTWTGLKSGENYTISEITDLGDNWSTTYSPSATQKATADSTPPTVTIKNTYPSSSSDVETSEEPTVTVIAPTSPAVGPTKPPVVAPAAIVLATPTVAAGPTAMPKTGANDLSTILGGLMLLGAGITARRFRR